PRTSPLPTTARRAALLQSQRPSQYSATPSPQNMHQPPSYAPRGPNSASRSPHRWGVRGRTSKVLRLMSTAGEAGADPDEPHADGTAQATAADSGPGDARQAPG